MFDSYKANFKKFKSVKFSSAYIAKIAILTALSFILYAFGKFNLPFMFPSFLEIQISELPALMAGFSMGPISGTLVIVLKCLLKFPMSSTAYVGEATDMLLGILFVLPASLIYHSRKDRKSALIGLLTGGVLLVVASIIINRYISIPFYTKLYFNGNFNVLVDMLKPLYHNIDAQSFYTYYLFVGVLPFNALRCLIVAVLTFVLYKRISKVLHWEGTSLLNHKIEGTHKVRSIDDTYKLASQLADTLCGGEVILLNGDLGAGKTTFTKGLAKALGISDEVTSPTFTILNTYEGGEFTLNHLDMYRIENADELYELGVEDVFDNDSITVIEWNKFDSFSSKVIRIDIKVNGEKERIFDIAIEENKDDKKDDIIDAHFDGIDDNQDSIEGSTDDNQVEQLN